MSALSFLSKKSWHTALNTNQEAVWKAEKAALDERRKVDELRKEREREREQQELERLHEQAGGKKARRHDMDWMYNAPATGAHVDKDEQEAYLLGKKRVDKLLEATTADEGAQLSRQGAGASSSDPIKAQTNVDSDRDMASKIRQDPMFAIRQQEQAAYQALLKDPARLRAMRKKEEEEEREGGGSKRHRRKDDRKRHRDDDDDERRRSPRSRGGDRSGARRSRDDERRRDDDRRDRPRLRDDERRKDDDRRDIRRSRDDDRRRDDDRSRDHHLRHDNDRQRTSYSRDDQGRGERRYEERRNGPPRATALSTTDAAAEREAKLAAMQQNAAELTTSRSAYLAKVQAEEEAAVAREEALRAQVHASRDKKRGGGFGASEVKGSFMKEQERSLYGSSSNLDLADRLRRGRDGLQRFDGGD